MYFLNVAISFLWKKAYLFIWTNMNPLGRFASSFYGWNWPSGAGKEDKYVEVYKNNDNEDNENNDGQWTNFDQNLKPHISLREVKKKR